MKISTNKTLHIAGLAGLLTMVGLPALAQSETETAEASQTESSTTSDLEQNADSTILKDIHNINLAEIKMAGFAEKHAANREVKSFAQRLVRDHKASETAIVPVAKDANVTLTEGLKPMTDDAMVRLQALVGSQFDREFLKDMSDGHQAALDTLDKDQDGVKDTKVLAFVAEVKVAVEKHKSAADALIKKLGETSRAD